MKGLPAETDFVVIGAGVAGLRAAIELASAGRVLVLDKKEVTGSNTRPAQGSIAAALSDEDEVTLHLQDTLIAGDGLCLPEAVKILVEEGPQRIEELIAWGTQFNRSGTKLVFGFEGAHSRNRILHAQGDSTGREILRALYAKVQTLKNISVREFEFSTGLEIDSGQVTGISLLSEKGLPEQVMCSAALLATGGMGQLYRNTTNSEVATGDGVAMAFRAGAEVSDMEFVQFHPTALFLKKSPRFLLSEALLGEGAYLRNIEMDRFMAKYHPLAELAPRDVVARAIMHEMEVSHVKDAYAYLDLDRRNMEMNRFMAKYHPLAELAPRDVVARAIMHEMEVSHVKDAYAYLDLTHLKASQVQKHFPRIYATCLQYNIDITEDLIPIRPAAHYAMGGVRTDLDGKTNLVGLYAAGEAAASGIHGANRRASNALLEGLVYGARAGRAMRQELKAPQRSASALKKFASQNGPLDAGVEELI